MLISTQARISTASTAFSSRCRLGGGSLHIINDAVAAFVHEQMAKNDVGSLLVYDKDKVGPGGEVPKNIDACVGIITERGAHQQQCTTSSREWTSSWRVIHFAKSSHCYQSTGAFCTAVGGLAAVYQITAHPMHPNCCCLTLHPQSICRMSLISTRHQPP